MWRQQQQQQQQEEDSYGGPMVFKYSVLTLLK